GQPTTICHAFVGETVVLPCITSPPGELIFSKSLLYWQINGKIVHFFKKGEDSLDNQEKQFDGRTSLFLDQMKHGNLSLKITNVQLEDDAEYTCIYKPSASDPTKKFYIKLSVSVSPRTDQAPTPSGQSQVSSRSPSEAPCLAMLLLSFHLLVTLGAWLL
ncbi:VTCN1 inhibitor, partial [Serilophus lunatus]|nr:VTCN1 inhibitor [Serilophus lunatus]